MFELLWQSQVRKRARLQPGLWRFEPPRPGVAVGTLVDAVLRGQGADMACLPAAPVQHVLLPQNGGLISNLRLWENTVLPRWFHGGALSDADEQRLLGWVVQLMPQQTEPARWLHQTVGQTSVEERALAGLLRTLMAPAPWIWLEADWLLSLDPAHVRPALDLLAAETAAAQRVVLVHAPDAQAAQAMAGWSSVTLTIDWMEA